MKTIKKIAVVGGGTAGFIAALILKRRFDLQIDVIHSSKIGIIGVGEGSTEHFYDFVRAIGDNPCDVIRKTDATLKIGVMFENWTKDPYLHSNQNPFTQNFAQTKYYMEHLIAKNVKQKDLTFDNSWKNLIEKPYLDIINKKEKDAPSKQFHFNTFKLNEYLTNKAKELGVNIFDDEITDIKLNKEGEIDKLKGHKKTYNYDFYIDCTGFKKLLISKLGAKWQSYSKWLKMKAAIAFPTKDTDEYNMWTLARAMDYGWMWRIPVWGRWGNGYVYDSDYINENQAQQEAEKYLGYKVDVARSVKFDPGALDKFWIKNCVAIGLSANFVEPLEATSIGSAIQQTFLLMHKLPLYDEKTISVYNNKCNNIMNNIRDFVILHYVVKKNNSQFWKDIQKIDLPDSLKENLKIWKHRLPIREDFSHLGQYVMFTESHWINVLHGLGLFDIKSIKKQAESKADYVKNIKIPEITKLIEQINKVPTIKHKQFLNIIRQGV